MSTLRDRTLAKVDHARTYLTKYGIHRFTVILRRSVWDGAEAGDGAVTVQDIVLTPLPHVVPLPATDRQAIDILVTGAFATTRLWRITSITPQFTRRDGSIGGYTAQQVNMRRNPETMNVVPTVILIGDDGFARETVQMHLLLARPFRWEMIVQETDRRQEMISALAGTPSPVSLSLATSPTVQMKATGTFEDGTSCEITPMVAWSVDDPTVATVDVLGVVTAVAIGTTTLRAIFRGVAAPPVTLTVGA